MDASNRVRLGEFELDLRAGELREADRKVLLQEQPFQILLMLVERHGDLVHREEIRKRLWPNDTIVEFDHSIHTAIKKLRQALGDAAENPRYVETVARRGYRLLVPVESGIDPSMGPAPNVAVEDRDEAQLGPGAALVGKKISHYRVLGILGGGGMGLPYWAEDIKLGRSVALKFLPEELAGDSVALERFEREAKAMSSLDHPNICAVHEFGEHEGRHFIVMPLLEGKTLRDRISSAQEKNSPFSTEELVSLALQIADGLAAAHRQGIKYLAYNDRKGIHIKQIGSDAVLSFPQPDELKGKDIAWEILSQAWFPDNARFLANAHPQSESMDDWSSKTTSIWAFSVTGEAPQKVRDNAVAFSVSPDGSMISFGQNPDRFKDLNWERELWVMSPSGENAHKLYDTEGRGGLWGLNFMPGSHRPRNSGAASRSEELVCSGGLDTLPRKPTLSHAMRA